LQGLDAVIYLATEYNHGTHQSGKRLFARGSLDWITELQSPYVATGSDFRQHLVGKSALQFARKGGFILPGNSEFKFADSALT